MSAKGFYKRRITRLGLNDKEAGHNTFVSQPLWRLISLLTVGQVYALIGATFFLVSGSFVTGYRWRSETAEAHAAGDRNRIEKLTNEQNKMVEEKSVLTKLNEFLIRMQRYNTAKVKKEKIGKRSTGNQNQRQQAARELAEYLDDNVEKDNDQNGNPIVKLELNQDRNDSRISFRDQGLSFDIPKEVKDLTTNVNWIRSKSESTPVNILQSLPQQMLPKLPSEPLFTPIPFVDPFDDNEIEPPGANDHLPQNPRLAVGLPNSINRKEADSPPKMKWTLLHLKRRSFSSHLRL